MTAPGGGGYGYKSRPDPGSRIVPAGQQPSRVGQPQSMESRRGAIAAREAVAPSPQATIPGIRETRSGLVFRDQFNRANGAIGADWNNIAGGANWSIAANALKNASTAGGDRIVVADAKMAETLGEMVVQGMMRRVGANRDTFPGIRGKWSNPGAGENCYFGVITNNGAANVLQLSKVVAGAVTLLAEGSTIFPGDLNPYKLFTKAGEQKLWALKPNLLTIDLLLQANDAALDALTGRGGLSAGWFQATADYHEYDDFAIYRGNTVKCSRLPSGYKLNVVHPAGSDVSAVESGGVAVADLVGRGCPCTRVEVLTAANVVLHSLTPTLGVWGGGEYEVAW